MQAPVAIDVCEILSNGGGNLSDNTFPRIAHFVRAIVAYAAGKVHCGLKVIVFKLDNCDSAKKT